LVLALLEQTQTFAEHLLSQPRQHKNNDHAVADFASGTLVISTLNNSGGRSNASLIGSAGLTRKILTGGEEGLDISALDFDMPSVASTKQSARTLPISKQARTQ
jgi:hypothetical protein